MSSLLTSAASGEPKFLLLLLVSTFLIFFARYMAQMAAKQVSKNWPSIWKSMKETAHRWLNLPPEMILKDAAYYRRMIRFNRIQWWCMKLVSYDCAFMFWGVVAYSALIVFFGKPASTFGFALMLGIGMPGFLFRMCRVECALLDIQRKELEKNLTGVLTREAQH